MSNLAMCRVCLAVDVRMFSIINTPLQDIYERITNIQLTHEGRLYVVCYICHTRLKKCHILMTRALNANQILAQVLQSGLELTNPPLIDRQSYNLADDYCISPIEHFSTIHVAEADTSGTKDSGAVKPDDAVKTEDAVICKIEKLELVKYICEENYDNAVADCDQDNQQTDAIQSSNTDSEDDVPLLTISNNNKKTTEKRKPNVRVKKKKWMVKEKIEKGFIADFAKEIVLSKQEQAQELEARAASLNYLNSPLKCTLCYKGFIDARAYDNHAGKHHQVSPGFIADFAKEIVLSKQQQAQELEARAASLNYLNSPLKCTLCYKGFIDARAYDNHAGKHHQKSGSYECEICHMRYSTQRQLRTHEHTSHTRRYQCLKCSHQSHTSNQAREHEKWHCGYTYECKLCGQTFRKPTSYLTHMRKRHPTQHVCNICGDSFVGRHGLLMHKSKAHRDDKAENPSEPASERFCGECNIQFASRDAWKRHILSSAKHTLHNEHSPQCKICSARFQSTSALQTHLRDHERSLRASRSAPVTCRPAAKLACDQCESHFVNRSKLQAHIKRKHLGLKYNKNIVCEVCGKKCTSNASLKYHQRTHTGEKPYPCKECPRQFADKNQLRIHTRTHTGERPYCCAVCGKRFSQKPALTRHYRVHTGAKPYICQFCSKPFSQSNSMKLHVQTVHLKMPSKRKHVADCTVTHDSGPA